MHRLSGEPSNLSIWSAALSVMGNCVAHVLLLSDTDPPGDSPQSCKSDVLEKRSWLPVRWPGEAGEDSNYHVGNYTFRPKVKIASKPGTNEIVQRTNCEEGQNSV
jgi:hypothetical protein